MDFVITLAAGLMAGYLAGRLRPGRRLFDKALDAATGDRRGIAWAAGGLLVLLALAVHPRQSIRYIRSWRRPEERLPAPEMDPGWGRRSWD